MTIMTFGMSKEHPQVCDCVRLSLVLKNGWIRQLMLFTVPWKLLRSFWKLGRVKEVLTGRDGKVRGVVLQVAGKGRQITSLYHPIQLLYPLEFSQPCHGQPDDNNPEHSTVPLHQTDSD